MAYSKIGPDANLQSEVSTPVKNMKEEHGSETAVDLTSKKQGKSD
jgi:hypothetical protein